MILILALLIGVVAGHRTATPLAVVAWAAWLGRLPLAGGPLGFMGAPITPWLFTAAAVAELIGDKLPKAPSRKAPALLIGRLIAGGLCGAALGAAHGALIGGA
ncbi:DUF4126 domain-containing protein, partial [Caulobacter sp. 17J65-9]|uniref:DUF4126 domain-containing protein n=1 Tax=Caulobacter sp. 17J65-9 TaxID=2709382 RepID=UPI0013C8DEB8